MFILAAVFLTTCQTVFSEMPCPQSLPARQTHRNSGPLSIRPRLTTHRASLSPSLVRARFVCACPYQQDLRWPSAPRDVASSPTSVPQARDGAAPTEQDCQNRSITLSSKSLAIGQLPEHRCLSRCKPVAQARAQLADTFDTMDAGGQLGA